MRGSALSPRELMDRVKSDPNRTAPRKFARFHMVRGNPDEPHVGDEFVVRMPGPWAGPVWVIDVGPRSFRLATLRGHLEAGQIEFRASADGELLRFEIESWVRSGSRLMRSYEFADPSIVHAYYDPDAPLQGRNMLLKLQAFGLVHLYVGVRVNHVYEEARQLPEGTAHVWGWSYQTLEGHVEMGEMRWEVWKWPHDGRVEFHVHAVSREAPIRNPLIRLGFRLACGHERQTFLEGTKRRMRTFTELALSPGRGASELQEAAAALTSRPSATDDPAHAALAQNAQGFGAQEAGES